jgi:hypothetical protein
MILAISTRRDLDEKKRKSKKKTVIGHMQNRSVLTIFYFPAEVYANIDKVYSKLLPSAFNENLDIE